MDFTQRGNKRGPKKHARAKGSAGESGAFRLLRAHRLRGHAVDRTVRGVGRANCSGLRVREPAFAQGVGVVARL